MMNPLQMEQLKVLKHKMTRFMMMYKFALTELETRIEVLQEEFQMLHDYNPIEHSKSRIKSPESIVSKLMRKSGDLSFRGIREHVQDIAGLRITCSFLSDIYVIRDMLQNQSDLKILHTKDYIENPKPNGYQSLHLLIEVPVFMSDGREEVAVEVQIRTIAMDFWASLEHKIFYKYEQSVPPRLLNELKEAADVAAALDRKMEQLHQEIQEIKESDRQSEDAQFNQLIVSNQKFAIPPALLALLQE